MTNHPGGRAPVPTHPVDAHVPAREMAALLGRFLHSLTPDQRRAAERPFEDPNRTDWHYVPRRRAGLPVGALASAGRAALDDLLSFTLSEAGLATVRGIMALEEPLGLLEGRPDFRDPGNYSVTVFGEPGGRAAWGWRIEGHHLSLNFTGADGRILGVTPAFLGAHPARVPDGLPLAGHRVLGPETDLAFELVRGLGEPDLATATIRATSLGNIITGPGREHSLQSPVGVPLGRMPEPLRNLAIGLIEAYAGTLRGDLAATELDRVRGADLNRMHFAWAGSRSGRDAHYWRLHGPVTLIEFDNTQNDANHIHSVWHDLERTFGGDPLRRHYEQGHGHDH